MSDGLVAGFMIVDSSSGLEFLPGQAGFHQRDLIHRGRVSLKGRLVPPGYHPHVGRHSLDVVFPKAVALSAVLLRAHYVSGHLSGVSKHTVMVLCRLELVAVGRLLALDAVSRPRHRGQPLGVDFRFAMQAGAIR